MKAAVWHDRLDVRIQDWPEPEPKFGEVKIAVKWCGLCGSDLHEYTDGPTKSLPSKAPHPLTGQMTPIVQGHELSGEVVKIGEGVTKLKVGDHVVVEPLIICGKCNACLAGRYNVCEKLGFHGHCGSGGGFAEFTTMPERFVHKLPDNVSYETASLFEPLCVVLHAIECGNFKLGMDAVVLGAGPIGQLQITALKAAGARRVFCIQRKSERQKFAMLAGADYLFDPAECDPVAEIKKLTDGGADISFETTASQDGWDWGIKCLRKAGTIVQIGIMMEDVHFNPGYIVDNEIRIQGIIGYRNLYPAAIQLVSDGRINIDFVITKKIFIDDLIKEGFELLLSPEKKKHSKIIVTPDKGLL